jgi:hypothetical protein
VTFLESLPPGPRLIVAALAIAVLVVVAVAFLRIVDRAIDAVVKAWGGWMRRRDARRRSAEPRMWRS